MGRRIPNKIVLIGFMGTGKTLVGKALAQELGWRFVDSDALVEKNEGMTIHAIFKHEGEPYFREAEARAIRGVSRLKNIVISVGGGAVLEAENVKNLKKGSVVICLNARPGAILSRLKGDKRRPLLGKRNRIDTVRRLLKLRKPYYKDAAEYFLATDGLTTRRIVGKILDYLTSLSQGG